MWLASTFSHPLASPTHPPPPPPHVRRPPHTRPPPAKPPSILQEVLEQWCTQFINTQPDKFLGGVNGNACDVYPDEINCDDNITNLMQCMTEQARTLQGCQRAQRAPSSLLWASRRGSKAHGSMCAPPAPPLPSPVLQKYVRGAMTRALLYLQVSIRSAGRCGLRHSLQPAQPSCYCRPPGGRPAVPRFGRVHNAESNAALL